MAQGLVLRDRLQDVPVSRHVPDGPLAQPRAGQPEHVAAWLVDMSVESGLHLVVSEESNVARVGDCQDLPVP